jgi:hypothetical protein
VGAISAVSARGDVFRPEASARIHPAAEPQFRAATLARSCVRPANDG